MLAQAQQWCDAARVPGAERRLIVKPDEIELCQFF